jgi:hypothetical protein
VVTAPKEEVERAETHEIDILGPHASSVASSLRSMSTGQDINDEAQSVISQVEGVTLYLSFLSHPESIIFILLQDPGEATSPRQTSISPAAAAMSALPPAMG